jgi:hypothetical protein
VTLTWTTPYRVSSARPVAVPETDEVEDVVDGAVVDDEFDDDELVDGCDVDGDVDGVVVALVAPDVAGDAVREWVRKLKTATTPTAVAVRT